MLYSTHASDTGVNLSSYSMSARFTSDRLRLAGTLVLALILVTTGSFIRERAPDEYGSLDWVVIAQLGLALAGGCFGLLLLRRHSLSGFGARVLTAYILAILIAALFSPYLFQVMGYWILLAGACVLCMGLVSSSRTEMALRDIERAILSTVSFMLLKDTLVDAFYFRTQVDRMEELGIGMYRFGMGSTSSNAMGLLAAVAFCMSFKSASGRRFGSFWGSLWPGFFTIVLLLTRTRIALFALVVSSVVRWWFRRRARNVSSDSALVGFPCLAGGIVLVLIMAWLWNVPLVTGAVDFVNRGADSGTIGTVTGRTDVWSYALKRIFESPTATAFGHGYGVSKLVLNENNWTASWSATHSHNTFLESVLSTGLMGTLPLVVLIIYSLGWLYRFWWMSRAFSLPFRLRAVMVVSAVLSSTMTESDLVTKIGPALIIYLFYVLSLDRHAAFLQPRC